MDGQVRREAILRCLSKAENPVSGTDLGRQFHVSRQVIVQDIALLRTENPNIVSTHKGYLLAGEGMCERVYQVKHSREEIEEELNIMVDAGGYVKDVFVEHPVYGRIEAPLPVSSRREVRHFLEKTANVRPLTEITDGVHFHTVKAENEAILDEIEEVLRERGFLIQVCS